MTKRKMLGVLLGLFALFFSVFNVEAGHLDQGRRPDTVLYKVKEGIGPSELGNLNKLLNSHGLQGKRQIEKLGIEIANFQKGLKTEEELSEALMATGAVEFAEPDYLVAPVYTPNDPRVGNQWYHNNIKSYEAWDSITGNPAVTVAVLDTGVEDTHPDLVGQMVLPGLNTVDNTSNTSPVHGHGTAVAGCFGATGDNNLGIAGVGFNVGILPVRVSNQSDGWAYYSDIAEGIRWSADQGAKVINASYGVGGSSTISSAAQYAKDQGALFLASAGNDNLDVTFPDFTSFVLVGATDSANNKASFSNYGTAIDVTAPGTGNYTTHVGNTYASWYGTSFSSPVAAGVAALIYSVNPNFSPDDVQSILFSTAQDIGDPGDDHIFGHGLVDAAAAVQAALNYQGNVTPVAMATASPNSGIVALTVTLDGSQSHDSDGNISSYSWNFGDGSSGNGMMLDHTYMNEGTYNATLTVTDNGGASNQDSVTITVEPDPNILHPPSNMSANLNGTTVNVSWVDNAQIESGFYLERGVKVKKNVTYSRIATLPENSTSYVDTLSSNGTYLYRVQAFNSQTLEESSFSNTSQVKYGNKKGNGGGRGKPNK